MKNLKNAEKSDGNKAYGLSQLIQGNFNVPDGIVINEKDIEKIIEGNTEELENYLSDLRIYDDLTVRVSAVSKDDATSYKGIFKSKNFVPFDMSKLSDAVQYVNNCAKDKMSEYKIDDSFNIIIQKMIKDVVFSGVAFSDILDEKGNKVVKIQCDRVFQMETVQKNTAVITIKKSEVFDENAKVSIYGKANDYSKMLNLARDVCRIEKRFNRPVIVGWCITEKKTSNLANIKAGDLFYLYVEPMSDAEKILKYFSQEKKDKILSLNISIPNEIGSIQKLTSDLEKQQNEIIKLRTDEYEFKKRINLISGQYKQLKIDDIFEFGFFDGKKLKWRILDINNDKIFIFCESIICIKPFNENGSNIWKQCTLRKWLNEHFYRQAFDNAEKKCIIEVNSDKVTLLSKDEAETLLRPCDWRTWWTRTAYPEDKNNVFIFNRVDKLYHSEANFNQLVRPALYLKL